MQKVLNLFLESDV